MVAAAGAGAALAVGGVVAKRVLGHGGKDDGANGAVDLASTEAEDKVVPVAKEKAPPKPKPAKSKADKAKPKAAPKPDSAKAKPPLPKAPPKPKPAEDESPKAETGTALDE